MLLTNWLTLFKARLNRPTLARRRTRSPRRRGDHQPIVVAAEVLEDRQLLSSTSLAPSIGGYGFMANPESTFSIPVSGSFTQHIDQTTSYTPSVGLQGGSQAASGTQHQVLDIVAAVTSNGTQTYSEIDTVTYDVTSGDSANGSHLHGNFTYSLLASVGGGISTWNIIYSTSDTSVGWTTSVSNGDSNGSTIYVNSNAGSTTTGSMNNWTNFNNNSATGFSTQTTIATSTQTVSGSYWHATPGGQVNGTISGGGSSFDLSTFTENLIRAPGSAWTGSGTAMASGSGGNNSSFSGSGTYFSNPVSGTIRESGGTDNGYHYSANGTMNSDFTWSVTGSGSSSGSSSDSNSYSGGGTSTTSGSTTVNGITNEWSQSTTINQSGSSTDSSSFSIDMSLTGAGWTATDGSATGSGSSSYSSSTTGTGSYSTLSNNIDVEGGTGGGSQDQSQNNYNTSSTLGSDGNWVTSGSASSSSSGSSSSSSSGSGSFSRSAAPGGATGSVSGDIDESNGQSSSFNYNSGYTLNGGGSWVLTSGSGSSSGSSSSSDSTSGEGSYSATVTIGNNTVSRSGDQGAGSKDTSQSSYNASSAVVGGVWVTVSGSGSASGQSSSTGSYDGEGSYSASTGNDSVSGTTTESGGTRSDTQWNSNSTWVNATSGSGSSSTISGWVTTASSSNSGSTSSNSTYTGSGSYGNSGTGQLAGAATVSGTMSQNGGGASSMRYNSSSVMDATGLWTVVSGSGSSSSSSSSNFTSAGSGSYNRSQTNNPSVGTWSASGTVNEGAGRSNSGSTSTNFSVVNGRWVTTSGSGSSSGSQSNSSAWSGSGTYSLTVSGGRMTGTISDQAGNSESQSFSTNSNLGSNGQWTTTGSGSGSASGSTNFSFSVASGSYTRSVGGGTVNGTVTAFESDLTTTNSNYGLTLDSAGNWNLTSGSGSSTEQDGFGQSYSGSGSYATGGLSIAPDGSTVTLWTYNATITESGSQDQSEGTYQNVSVVGGQWVQGSSGDISSTGFSSSYSESGSGGYVQGVSGGTVSGTYSQNNSNASGFRQTTTTDANGNGSNSASGSSSNSSGFSYSGGGTVSLGGTQGQYSESGSGSASTTFNVQMAPGASSSDPWVVTSGSFNLATGSASQGSYSGTSSTSSSGNGGGMSWNATTQTSLNMSQNSSASESDGFTWQNGTFKQTSGSQSNSTSQSESTSGSTTGSYTQSLGDGTISGSYGTSSSGSASVSAQYSGSYSGSAWNLSGTGSIDTSGSSSASYSGSGTYSGGGISGSNSQGGQTSGSSQSHIDLNYVGGGFVATSGTSTESGSDSSMFSYSGSSNFTSTVPGGSVSGSAQESGSTNWNDNWNSNSSLNAGSWVLTSGSDSGSGSTSYSFSASASGTFTGSFDGNGVLSGTINQSSKDQWSESETQTGNVVGSAWVYSDSGSGSGSSSSSYSYSGSGSSSQTTPINGGSTQFSSNLSLSGSSSGSSQSSWQWGDGPSGSWFTATETKVSANGSSINYSSSGSSSSTVISGNYAGGNGSETISSSANGRSFNESFSSTVTTVINENVLAGVDVETTTVTGSGSGSGSATASSTSSSYSDTKSTSSNSSNDNWSSMTSYMQQQDSFNYTSNWSNSTTMVNGVVTSGSGSSSGSMSGSSINNTVGGSMSSGGTMASGWSSSFSMSGSGSGSGSGGGSGSGSSYTTSGSTSSSWGPGTIQYNQVIHTPGFSPQAYTGGVSPVTLAAPGAPGTPAGNSSMPDLSASFAPAVPAMGAGVPAGVVMSASLLPSGAAGMGALAAAPFGSGPDGMPAADLTSGFVPSPAAADPDGYSNGFYRFLGENIIRPTFGDQFLVNASDGQLLAATTVFATATVLTSWFGGPAVFGSGSLLAAAGNGAIAGGIGYLGTQGSVWAVTGGQAPAPSAEGLATSMVAGGVVGGLAHGAGALVKGIAGKIRGPGGAADDLAGAAGRCSSGGQCFVTGTLVHLASDGTEGDLVIIAAGYEIENELDENPWSTAMIPVFVAVGFTGQFLLDRRRVPRKRKKTSAVDNVLGFDVTQDEDEDQAPTPNDQHETTLVSPARAACSERALISLREPTVTAWQCADPGGGLPAPSDPPTPQSDLAHELSPAKGEPEMAVAADPRPNEFISSAHCAAPGRERIANVDERVELPLGTMRLVVPRRMTHLTAADTVPPPKRPGVPAIPSHHKPIGLPALAHRPGRWWLNACLLLAGCCLAASWLAPGTKHTLLQQQALASVNSDSAGQPMHITSRFKEIENIQLGERVAGENPLRDQVEEFEPDPATWKLVKLHVRKEGDRALWVELLRPNAWIDVHGVQVGAIVDLDLPEMGAVGPAAVLSIEACPAIQPGDGAVVTGKFTHESDGRDIISLRLEGEAAPTGVTASHPYWSESRNEFVPAANLTEGELVNTLFGPRRVHSVARVAYSGMLNNLETTEHVYRVALSGTLVHNAGCAPRLEDLMDPSTLAKEGIYEFTSASGKKYVGQSGNIAQRIQQHLNSGKLLAADILSLKSTSVLGGKPVREVAEQLRIIALGGVSVLENIRNPIGPARKALLPPWAQKFLGY